MLTLKQICDNLNRGIFFQKFIKGNNEECWNWLGTCSPPDKRASYSSKVNGIKFSISAARIIYFLSHGEFDEDLCVLHKCDNVKCVNPNHLFLGTRKDNNRDRAEKGRSGLNTNNHKLNAEQVLEIRKLYSQGMKVMKLAEKFNIHNSQVSNIISRKQWKHI